MTSDKPADSRLIESGGRPWVGLLALTVLVSAGCNAALYFRQLPLWGDECALILNVMHKSGAALYFGHLDLAGPTQTQAAPPLFLLMMKMLYARWGATELAMRCVPFIAALLAVPLFGAITWRLFGVRVAACILPILALCDKFTEHAATAKQYSTDLFVALILLALWMHWRRETPLRRFTRLALVALIAFWFSYPSVFIFGGLSLSLLPEMWHGNARTRLAWISGNLMAGISFIALHLSAVRAQRDPFLLHYWSQYFPDYSHPMRVLAWLPQRIIEMGIYLHQPLGVLLIPLAIIGAFCLLKGERRALGMALIAPIALAVLAAAFQQYPFGAKRVTLYLIPSELLLAAAGLDFLRLHLPPHWRRWWWAPALAIILNGLVRQSLLITNPKPQSYLKPAVVYLRAHRRPDEPIYVLGRAITTFQVIWPQQDSQIHLETDPAAFIPEKRFWAIQGFDIDKGPVEARSSANVVPDPTQTFRTRGSLVALYHP